MSVCRKGWDRDALEKLAKRAKASLEAGWDAHDVRLLVKLKLRRLDQ